MLPILFDVERLPCPKRSNEFAMKINILLATTLLYGIAQFAQADDSSPFYLQNPLPDSISWVDYKGEAYQQFLVRKTDPPQPQWGDGANGQLRKRAQLVPTVKSPLNTTKTISFHFLIPDDWKISEWPVLIAASHSANLEVGPWSLYINRNKLQFAVQIDNPDGKQPDKNAKVYTAYTADTPFVIDRLHHFEMEIRVAQDMTGYAKGYLDGKQFIDYKGPTVSTNEKGLPYDKIGPYVFSKNLKWPFPNEDHKRILMRIP